MMSISAASNRPVAAAVHRKKSCGTGVVTKAIGNKTLSWHLRTPKSVKVGQVVEIGFPEASLIKSAMAVYLLPLFGLILGAVIGNFLLAPLTAGGEGITILASVLFAAGGMWLAKRVSRPLEDESKRQVTLIRVLGEPIQ